ncbi:hypothetical protein THAOC_35327 [Thalassiosira oceanica]|uniref:Chitin-binding type-2 domain-containing protein n=1 Tax=Thalassiosira oceanica TaxID=159749 RepID=K0RHD1_THAOC|nr:hypothetical protein THAOC_35327 [Thalassiosira oceanica]|eukprot:EJK46032.1 hypothetical protein THAOC_35327 [Thalassiosira oceanica]
MVGYLFGAITAAISCGSASEATRHSRRRLRLDTRQDSPTRIRSIEHKLDCTSQKDNPCEGADELEVLPLFPDCQYYIQCVPHAPELFRCKSGEIFDYEKQACSVKDEGTCICEQSPRKWVDIREALDPDSNPQEYDEKDAKAFKASKKASPKSSKSAKTKAKAEKELLGSKGAKTSVIGEESKGGAFSENSWTLIGTKSPSSTPTTSPTTNPEPTSTPTSRDCFAAPGESFFEDGDFPRSPWSTSGDGNWTIDEGDTYQGLYSIKSPDFNGSPSKRTSRATFSTCEDFKGGTLTFSHLASVLPPSDVFVIYIDGTSVQHVIDVNDWSKYELKIPAGSHTVDFSYEYNIFNISAMPPSPPTRRGVVYLDAFVLTEKTTKRPRIHLPWTHNKLEEKTTSGSRPENVREYGWAIGILVVAVLLPLAVYTSRMFVGSAMLRLDLDETDRLNDHECRGRRTCVFANGLT